jgi:hypothetical protein
MGPCSSTETSRLRQTGAKRKKVSIIIYFGIYSCKTGVRSLKFQQDRLSVWNLANLIEQAPSTALQFDCWRQLSFQGRDTLGHFCSTINYFGTVNTFMGGGSYTHARKHTRACVGRLYVTCQACFFVGMSFLCARQGLDMSIRYLKGDLFQYDDDFGFCKKEAN